MHSKAPTPRPAAQAESQFETLRKRNEYHVHIAQILRVKRERHARIDRVIQAQRERKLRHAG